MPTTNADFSAQITAIQSKASSLAASTTDPKDLVFLGKALEALTVPNSVSEIIIEGNTQEARVVTQGNTSVAAVNSAGATQVTAVSNQAASYTQYPTATTTAVNKTLAANEFVLVTAAGKTVSLPAGGTAGQKVIYVSVGNFTNTVVAPNGSEKIMGLAESMTIDNPNTTITFMYHGATAGWRAF
jgi:hypothetical protein